MGLLDRLLGSRQPSPVAAPNGASAAAPVFAVIDVETTGLSPASSRVLELAVVLTDHVGRPVWEWSGRFNPEGPVGATHVHGITGEDVADAPRIRERLDHITQALNGRVVVAHNAGFDVAFLRAEYERAGWDMPWVPTICTMQAGRVYLPHLHRHRLGDCCEACGVQLTDAHSALGDARAHRGHAFAPTARRRSSRSACYSTPTQGRSHEPKVSVATSNRHRAEATGLRRKTTVGARVARHADRAAMDFPDTPSGVTPQPTPPPTDLVYTTREVADLLKIDINSIRLARTTGDLPYRQLGASAQSIRYTMEDIEVLLAKRARAGASWSDPRPMRSLPAPRTRRTE